MGKLKLQQLGGPRPAMLFDDYAFEDSCNNPGDPPERKQGQAKEDHDAELVKHARAVERFAAWERYTETYDTSHLDPYLKAGEKPVVFMVKALPPEAAAAMLDLPEFGQRSLHAVKYGVVDILNLEVHDETGAPLGYHKVKRGQGDYGPALDDVTLALFADQLVLVQISTFVLAASRLPKGVSKSG